MRQATLLALWGLGQMGLEGVVEELGGTGGDKVPWDFPVRGERSLGEDTVRWGLCFPHLTGTSPCWGLGGVKRVAAEGFSHK